MRTRATCNHLSTAAEIQLHLWLLGPCAISLQAKHNRRCRQEALWAQPLSSSQCNKKKKICWLSYAEPSTQSHIFIMLGATLLPIPSTQSASINWHEPLCLQNQDDLQAGSEETQMKGDRRCSGGQFHEWKAHTHKQKCRDHAQPSAARQWLEEVSHHTGPSLSQHWDQNWKTPHILQD